MGTILLTKGFSAIVDDDDYEFLSQWKWHWTGGYAVRNTAGSNGRKQKRLHMHRIINKTPDGSQTDHINGDTLDNRK